MVRRWYFNEKFFEVLYIYKFSGKVYLEGGSYDEVGDWDVISNFFEKIISVV